MICQVVFDRSSARFIALFAVLFLAIALFSGAPSRAATVDAAWLRYSPIVEKETVERYPHLPAVVVGLNDTVVASAARTELVRGIRAMLGRTLRTSDRLLKENAIILGTFEAVKVAIPAITSLPELADDGFWLKSIEVNGRSHLLVAAPNDRGLLYGAMYLLRKMALAEPLASLNEKQSPYAPLRVLSHADNLDGTVERGHAGRSIFWEAGRAKRDLGRVADYGRLMASLGINGCLVNSSRGDAQVLTAETIQEAARLADVLRPWGVRLFLSVDIASPQTLAGGAADPLSPVVAAFWERATDDVYRAIPDLGGFFVSPASDGRIVPAVYGRSHADAANVMAAPLAKHDGLLVYITNCEAVGDWRNPNYDCARATFDAFHTLDGQFADNVILQTNVGPAGFQVREPVSPLLASLRQTHQAMFVSLAQELTGQQRHACYLAPGWKSALEFKGAAAESAPLTIKQIVAGRGGAQPRGGFIAEASIGSDSNWLGHPLAMANLYAFGRLSWNPDLATKAVAEEWARLTFGHEPTVVGTVVDVLVRSRRIYENYTGPLGAGPPANRARSGHGPALAANSSGLNDWRFVTNSGIGRDRTQATGTGFIGQYPATVAAVYESVETCPDDLLLFMHHVPYTHTLKTGKRVIQHYYDAHYQGARDAARMVEKWRRLDGLIDEPRYHDVLARLEYQAGHAQVWRDSVCNWLEEASGIADAEGRVGKHAKRTEAEDMRLDGFEARKATPWETASGGEFVVCTALDQLGSARWKYTGKAGWMDISVWYFDENDGASQFQLFVGEQLLDEWTADESLGDDEPSGDTATRRRIAQVALRPGDELCIEVTADGDEGACIDYAEIVPAE